MSCASLHSEHSSGLSKTLQDYRYMLGFLTGCFLKLFAHFKKKNEEAADGFFMMDKLDSSLSGGCFLGRMRLQ